MCVCLCCFILILSSIQSLIHRNTQQNLPYIIWNLFFNLLRMTLWLLQHSSVVKIIIKKKSRKRKNIFKVEEVSMLHSLMYNLNCIYWCEILTNKYQNHSAGFQNFFFLFFRSHIKGNNTVASNDLELQKS